VAEHVIDAGCAVVLTNATRIWSRAAEGAKDTVHDAFRLHEGRTVSGTLDWSDTAGEGTKIGRVGAIGLTGSYDLAWHDFSTVGKATFRYLLIPVPA
jgi:hypothetical protein